MSSRLLFIFAGGGVGAVARFLISRWGQKLTPGSFPVGTLIVNVLGCLLIGLLMAVFTGPYHLRDEYRLGLFVGLLGGLTTFSSFGWETVELVRAGHLGRAALNIVLTNAISLAAVWAGYRVADDLWGA